MAKKVLICYWFRNIHYVKRKQFHRKLFGTKEKTHRGKYTAVTQGFLSDKKFEKPIRSVIIIEKKHLDNILKILRQFGGNFRIFKIDELSS